MLNRVQLEELERDRPSLRVVDDDGGRPECTYGLFGPPIAKLGACVGECCDQLGESGITSSLSSRGPELAEDGPGGRLPSCHVCTDLRIGEEQPEQVASVPGDRRGVVPDPYVRCVPG